MRAIVAGGRNFTPSESDFYILKELIRFFNIDTIISGHATGADTFGEQIADFLSIKKELYPADWDNLTTSPLLIKTRKDGKKYNSLAGFIRNEKMAEVADMLIYFKGGNGTNDMVHRATHHNLQIISAEIAKSIYYSSNRYSVQDGKIIIDTVNGTLNSSELFEKYGYFKIVENLEIKGNIE